MMKFEKEQRNLELKLDKLDKLNGDKEEAVLRVKSLEMESSLVSSSLDQNYPFAIIIVRESDLKIFVDLQNMNLLFPKFNVHLKLFTEDDEVIEFTADNRNNPYKLYLKAPNIGHIDATLADDIGTK